MEIAKGNKNLTFIISITVLIGLLFVMFSGEYKFLYIMITALVFEGIFFDKERKKNLWKFLLGYLVLIIIVFSLFNLF